MPPVGFEPTISAGERPQAYALDRTTAGTGYLYIIHLLKSSTCFKHYPAHLQEVYAIIKGRCIFLEAHGAVNVSMLMTVYF